MRAVYGSRIAISLAQTEIDGLESAPLTALTVGAAWSWRGEAITLSDASAMSLGVADTAGVHTSQVRNPYFTPTEFSDVVMAHVVLSNGAQQFSADVIIGPDQTPALVFDAECPPREQDFWVSEWTEVDMLNTVIHHNANVVEFPAYQALSH